MLSYIFYLLVYPLLLILSVYAGHRMAARQRKNDRFWKPLGLENGIVGFYALLISFTLVQSGNHSQERSVMLHTIAADISEILRTSAAYDSTAHNHVRRYFTDFYQIMRRPFGQTRASVERHIEMIDSLDHVFDVRMAQYIAGNPTERDKVISLLSRTDRMESTYYRFMHSYHRKLPKMILIVLILFSMSISYLIGFISRVHQNRSFITAIIFVFMSVVTVNIIQDLDNPAFGFIQPRFDDIEEVMNTYQIPV